MQAIEFEDVPIIDASRRVFGDRHFLPAGSKYQHRLLKLGKRLAGGTVEGVHGDPIELLARSVISGCKLSPADSEAGDETSRPACYKES